MGPLIERCRDPDRATRKFACFAIGNAGRPLLLLKRMPAHIHVNQHTSTWKGLAPRDGIMHAGFHNASLYEALRPSIPPLVALLRGEEEDKTRANAAGGGAPPWVQGSRGGGSQLHAALAMTPVARSLACAQEHWATWCATHPRCVGTSSGWVHVHAHRQLGRESA